MKKKFNKSFLELNRFLKKYKYSISGTYFILLQILIVHYIFFASNLENDIIFWMCNLFPILFAIGFFTKNITLIRSLINLILIVQILWVLDFFQILFFNYSFLGGITSYLFQNKNMVLPTIFIHSSSILALFLIYKEKVKKYDDLILSVILCLTLYTISLNFTNPANNINCSFKVCKNCNFWICEILSTLPFYKFYSPFLHIILFAFPVHFFQKFLSKKNQNQTNKKSK